MEKEKEKQMPIEDYCDWLESLTNQGDTINARGLQRWIEEYASNRNTDKETFMKAAEAEALKQHPVTNVDIKNDKGDIIDNMDIPFFDRELFIEGVKWSYEQLKKD